MLLLLCRWRRSKSKERKVKRNKMRFINPLGNIAYERVVYDGDSSDGKGLVGISSLSWRMLT